MSTASASEYGDGQQAQASSHPTVINGVPAVGEAKMEIRIREHGITSTKPSNDHENNAAGNRPLPNRLEPHSNPLVGSADNRSVMWADPAHRAGSRSESPSRHTEPAGGVPDTETAKQLRGAGATVAGDVPQRRTKSAVLGCDVIDKGSVDVQPHACDAFTADAIQTLAREQANRTAHLEIVRQARVLMQALDTERTRRRDTPPSSQTIEQYRKKLDRLDRRGCQDHSDSESPLCAAIASYSASSQSFYAYRAAAAWRETNVVRALLARQDALQRKGDWGSDWRDCVEGLRQHCQQLQEIQSLSVDVARTMADRSPLAQTSKKDVLIHAPPGWRERFLQASARSKKYAAACVLLAICGMRPKEIEDGLIVRRRGPIVGVKINGAKVRETAGQPWRVLYMPADKFPDSFLRQLGHGKTKVYAAPVAAMRAYLHRLSPKVFPARAGAKQLVLSAYVLRHAVATELRQHGWSDEQLAAVLGERVAETSRHYGLYRRHARGGHEPVPSILRDKVKTAIPVRPRDKSWLAVERPAQAGTQPARKKVHSN